MRAEDIVSLVLSLAMLALGCWWCWLVMDH
jgi:hypothetical protein